MKKLFYLLLLFFSFASSVVLAEDSVPVLVHIDGEINAATASYVRESLDKAEEKGYSYVIFEIDTYGGSVLAAEQIKNMIMDSKIPTVAYVNNKAESAGVLLTIACEKVYMSKSATIGSAQILPTTEKNNSFWRSLLRDTAQNRGKNSKIIESMADSSIVIDGINNGGKLTNLTSKESLDLGISDGTVSNVDELMNYLKIPDSSRDYEEIEPSVPVKFISFISNQYISTVLLVVAMLGFILEIFSPGFGVGGILSIISFTLFFMGNVLAGNSNWYAVFIFVLGIILISIEIMIPGFGIAGISGIISVVLGIIFAMKSVEMAISSLAISIVITSVFAFYLIKKGAKSRLINGIRLNNKASSDKGFVSVPNSELSIGVEAVTLTVLKPSGFVEVNGNKYEVLAENGYIEKGEKVVVSKVEGFKTFVRRV